MSCLEDEVNPVKKQTLMVKKHLIHLILLFEMYALVKFSDATHSICPIKNVKVKEGTTCIVKYSGCKYEAELIASNETRENLLDLKDKLAGIGKKKHSYQKPRIIKIEKLNKLPVRQNSSISDTTDESNTYDVSNTVIEETDKSTSTVDNRNTTYTLTANPNDIEALPSEQSILESSDINSSNYIFQSSLHDVNILFPSLQFQTSTPETLRQDENSNHAEIKDANPMDVVTESASGEHPSPTDLDKHEPNNIELDEPDDPDDPEYEPQDKDTSDSASDAESAVDQTKDRSQNKSSQNKSHNVSNGFNISTAKNLPGSNRCNDDDLQVDKSRGRNGDMKQNFCFYCHTKHKKIARHLELRHRDEPDVKKFTSLPKNSIERRKIIAVIRKKGNFLFNTQTEYNDGELIVSRRPNTRL